LGEMLLWQLLLGREAHLVGNMHEVRYRKAPQSS
jgi:hypothetical protein